MTIKSTNFISYKFIDSQGNLRDKIIRAGKKLPNTYFDGSSFGFCPTDASDMLLVPDTESKHFDPIRQMDSVFCFVDNPEGFENRINLSKCFRKEAYKAMIQDDQTNGALFGVEPEFFVCTFDSADRYIPIDINTFTDLANEEQYKWYGCLPPLDKFQNVRNTIAERLEKAGFRVEAIHHEVAPGQCEFSWECGKLLNICDQMMLFKYIVSNTCKEFGYIADFRAKPFDNLNGSGCHVHQSIPLMRKVEPVFYQEQPYAYKVVSNSKFVEAYAQGLVDHYDELLEVCCVGDTSSKRLVPGFEAPTKENNGWGWHDRTKTVRIPGDGKRLEFRLPDPEMNPYVALPLMLKFGYDQVRKVITQK